MLYLTFVKVLLLLVFFQCHWISGSSSTLMASVGRARLTRGSPGMNGSLDSQLSSKVNKYKYTNTDEQILIHIDILGSNEELIKYTFTIYDLNDDGSLRFESHQKNQFSVIMMIFSKDEMMTLLKDCIVQKDDGWLDILCVPIVTVSHCRYDEVIAW